ncbi:MAG: hypothetical protein ACJAYU_000776, partial [Bradymonadia bacterium]
MKNPLRDLLIVVSVLALFACGGDEPEPAGNCGNFVADGTEQCDQGPTGGAGEGYGCSPECTIIPPTDEVCDDGDDNDFDGDQDCEDSDCLGVDACLPPPEICDDTIDNDEDGLIDCEDSDCASDTVACPVASDEVCDDGIDNDLDGDEDCDDDDCDLSGLCPEICDDEFDNDSDGALDCMDSECAGDRACPEACGDGRVDPGEECDDGSANGSEPDLCRDTCRLPRCGDAVLDAGEECDGELGSPGECWQGCTDEPATGCGEATVLDAKEHAAAHAGGFNFNAFGEYTQTLTDELTPPTSCTNGAPDGEDLVLYWVPETTGWYEINANFGQFEGDIVFWVMDAECGGELLGCGEDSATNLFGTTIVPAEAGAPLMIAVDLKGEFSELRLTATRIDEFLAPGAACNPGANDVCAMGYECNDTLASPRCELPLGSCQNPEDITDEFLFSFDGNAEVTRNTGRHQNLSEGTCGGAAGPEYVTVYTNAKDTPVSLSATGLTGGSTVHIARHCGAQSSEILCTRTVSADARIEVGESVFVSVDSSSAAGGFESFLLAERPIVGAGERCDLADPADSADVPTILCDTGLTCDDDTTRCMPDFGTSCAAPFEANLYGELVDGVLGFSLRAENGTGVIPNVCSPVGADLVARYVATTTGTARIEVSAGSAAVALAVQPTCGGDFGGCLEADAENTTLYAPITAGEEIFIIADPEGITAVANITIEEVPALELGDACVPDGLGIPCASGLSCADDDDGANCRVSDAGSCGARDTIFLGSGDSIDIVVGAGVANFEHACGTSSEVFDVRALDSGVLLVSVVDDGGRRDAGIAGRSACGDSDTEQICEFDSTQAETRLDLNVEPGEGGFFHPTNVTSGTITFTLVPLVGLGETCDEAGLTAQCAQGRCTSGRCLEGGVVSCDAPGSLLGGAGDTYAEGTSFGVDTTLGTSRSLSICGGSGSEYVTTFTAPADGELNVEWQSPGRDAVLYARTDCGSTGTQLQCSLADLAGL